MDFIEQLNYYINTLNCSSKELSDVSDLSPATISRYRNGERIPSLKNSQLEDLSKGISKLALSKGIPNITKEIVFSSLLNSLNNNCIDFEEIRKNFNKLISALKINVAEMARFLNFDASYFSRIRTGKRNPSNPDYFIDSVCNFVAKKYDSKDSKNSVSILINCSIEDISITCEYVTKLKEWFYTNHIETTNPSEISTFLKTLDDFDLNNYIKVIHFDEMKVPFVPFYRTVCKNYYGIEQMKQGELDFFKSTVFSKINEPIFMCSDMPMDDIAKDVEFGKKWMYAIAMTLKKGLHLNIIHNIDRPFNEMMLGLESWIPIYMTGQVSPFYLKGLQNTVYCHLNYVSRKSSTYW